MKRLFKNYLTTFIVQKTFYELVPFTILANMCMYLNAYGAGKHLAFPVLTVLAVSTLSYVFFVKQTCLQTHRQATISEMKIHFEWNMQQTNEQKMISKKTGRWCWIHRIYYNEWKNCIIIIAPAVNTRMSKFIWEMLF